MAQFDGFAKDLFDADAQPLRKVEFRYAGRYALAIGQQLQPLFVGRRRFQPLPRTGVKPRQQGLQEANLAGDVLRRLMPMRPAPLLKKQREGCDLGHGDDRQHQQQGASGQGGEELLQAVHAPVSGDGALSVVSGTKT